MLRGQRRCALAILLGSLQLLTQSVAMTTPATAAARLPEYYADTIADISDNLAGNFKRAFNNDGLRRRKQKPSIHLEDVAYSVDNLYVEINDTTMSYPEFRISLLQLELDQAMISYKLSLGDLQLRSKMRTITRTLFNDMYASTSATLTWKLHNFRIHGSVGLVREGDSFVIGHQHNAFFFDKGEIEQYRIENALPETTQFQQKDFSLFNVIRAEFQATLTKLLWLQTGVIAEFSAAELLLDESDAIAEFDTYLSKRTLRANLLMDNLINRAKTQKLFDDTDHLVTSLRLPYRLENSTSRHLLIANGDIRGMHTLSRLRNCSIFERNGTLRLYAQLTLREYRFQYNYSTTHNGFNVEGSIIAKVNKNTWNVELVKHAAEDPIVVLSADQISDMEIDYINLGSLMSLAKPLQVLLSGHVRMETHDSVRNFLNDRLQAAALQLPSLINHRAPIINQTSSDANA